jgi:TonB family protein
MPGVASLRPYVRPVSRSISLVALVALAFVPLGAACRSKDDVKPVAPDAAPSADAGPAPECRADDDCVPLNCCYGTSESSCIGRARAHCDAVVVQCGEATGARYGCACAAGGCTARLVAAATGAPSAAPVTPTGHPAAVGGLNEAAIIDVVGKHAADVRACRAAAHGAVGTIMVTWDVTPAGAVLRAVIAASSVADPRLGACLVRKISGWRFPRSKDATRVTYPFQFSS